jgi:hypothetical protein
MSRDNGLAIGKSYAIPRNMKYNKITGDYRIRSVEIIKRVLSQYRNFTLYRKKTGQKG